MLLNDVLFENNDSLENSISLSKYLIVELRNDQSRFVAYRHCVSFFMETHNNNNDLILPVFVDEVVKGICPVIDEMIAKGHFVVFYEGKGMSGHVGRKFCFYRVLIFLLKVNLKKLFRFGLII